MRLICIFLCSLILNCSSSQAVKDKSLCETCPDDNSGQYKVEILSRFIRNDSKELLEVDSSFKNIFFKCSKNKISSNGEWFYFSKDESRNYYHLISQGDYSTELWVVAVNMNNSIEYCFLGAASGGDGGDGFEIYSSLKDSILRQTKVYTSIFMNSQKNDFTDSLKIDSISVEYLVKKKGLTILKTDSVSKVSNWGHY